MPRPLVISEHDPAWPARFRYVAAVLRQRLAREAIRIDHIGSTAVPGLAAKDLIDVQITVTDLHLADTWPDELLPGVVRHPGPLTDHVPPGASTDPADWDKRFWSSDDIHVHVREEGRPNQRYALLFRDHLRADFSAAAAYGDLKRALAAIVGDDRDAYYAVKDPACDLIMAAAEQWAQRIRWSPPPSDA